MPSARRRPAAVAVIALFCAAAVSGCASPPALAGLQEQLNQAADAVNDINISLSVMQTSIDSLTVVVAKQDTTIARLANAAGIQIIK